MKNEQTHSLDDSRALAQSVLDRLGSGRPAFMATKGGFHALVRVPELAAHADAIAMVSEHLWCPHSGPENSIELPVVDHNGTPICFSSEGEAMNYARDLASTLQGKFSFDFRSVTGITLKKSTESTVRFL